MASISGFWERESSAPMSQLALLSFSMDVRVSIFYIGNGSSAYQAWKHSFISSLRGLLAERLRGCSLSVQLVGTLIWLMVLFSRSSWNAGVWWPLKILKLQDMDDYLQSPWPPFFPGKWKQTFICVLHHCSIIRPVVYVCHTSHSGGNSIAEWHLSVLPWWRIWGGSYSPASVTAIMAVVSLLLSRPAIGIDCSPCLLIVHALTGTRWMAVWSQLITGMEGCQSLWLQHECPKDTAPFACQTLEQVL